MEGGQLYQNYDWKNWQLCSLNWTLLTVSSSSKLLVKELVLRT